MWVTLKCSFGSNATILLLLKLTRTKPLPSRERRGHCVRKAYGIFPGSKASAVLPYIVPSSREISPLKPYETEGKMARYLASSSSQTIWALARADRQEFRRAE